ncbi:MAG: hypothetical protein ACYSUU_10515 [Planctomycetota bacterium]|jgi:hypothetical protein
MHLADGNTVGFFETGRPAATCAAAFLLGGCQHTHSHQDLNGTWKGTGHTINSAGRSETNKYLVLEVDENGLIEGVAGWRLIEGAGGHDGDVKVKQSEERLTGTLVPETGEIHLVETEENGYVHGTLIDRHRMRMVLVQPGDKPVASSCILVKVDSEDRVSSPTEIRHHTTTRIIRSIADITRA